MLLVRNVKLMETDCIMNNHNFLAFGIGSMIYSGLEFGQYFELERDTKCHNVLLALTPATRMAFIFIQMYFIFLNNEVSLLSLKRIQHISCFFFSK